jgi:hypothetical protein
MLRGALEATDRRVVDIEGTQQFKVEWVARFATKCRAMENVMLTVEISLEIAERLNKVCYVENSEFSEIVEDALRKYLGPIDPPNEVLDAMGYRPPCGASHPLGGSS